MGGMASNHSHRYRFSASRLRFFMDQQQRGATFCARHAGCMRQHVASIASGKTPNPSGEVVVGIAKALGVSVEDLYAEVECHHV